MCGGKFERKEVKGIGFQYRILEEMLRSRKILLLPSEFSNPDGT